MESWECGWVEVEMGAEAGKDERDYRVGGEHVGFEEMTVSVDDSGRRPGRGQAKNVIFRGLGRFQ